MVANSELTIGDFAAEAEVVINQIEPTLAFKRADLYGFVSAAWPYDGTPADAASEFAESVHKQRGDTAADYEIVFTATHDWWEQRQGDFETADDFDADTMDFVAKSIDGFLPDSAEAFAVTITSVDAEHTAIQVGDMVVSDGIGSDKYFVREKE